MNVVGIDIGAARHVAAVCREGEQEAEKAILRISSRRAGFDDLDRWMTRHGDVGLVVMESSGHYWMSLASHLRRRGLPVALVNPLSAKYFAKSRLQRTKSDPADARTLAVLGMSTHPTPREPLAGAELREAARFAMTLVTEQAKVCQRIQRLVDLGFPELRDAFEDPTCVSALAVLRQAPTAAAVQRKRATTLARATRPGGGRAIGPKRAESLKALAEQTVAPPELERQVGFELALLIEQYDLLEGQITQAESRLAGLVEGDVARRLQSIPGVGPATAATLLAEIGDIFRFTDVDQLLSYAGVHPSRGQLGSQGRQPGDELAHGQDRQCPPPRRALPDGHGRCAAQPRHRRALRPQARGGQVQDERPGALHGQSARPRLGCLAWRSGLRSRLPRLTRHYGT